MPDISQMSESKFLKRIDVGAGKLLTIKECVQENVAKDNQAPEMKWCVFFEETEKGMVLNKTNGELIAMITGERNSDNWGGHKVVLYDDPTISFGGKLVGGIRIRAPKNRQTPPITKQAPINLPEDDADELPDVPF